jgi:hypothetical protein
MVTLAKVGCQVVDVEIIMCGMLAEPRYSPWCSG